LIDFAFFLFFFCKIPAGRFSLAPNWQLIHRAKQTTFAIDLACRNYRGNLSELPAGRLISANVDDGSIDVLSTTSMIL